MSKEVITANQAFFLLLAKGRGDVKRKKYGALHTSSATVLSVYKFNTILLWAYPHFP